DRVRRRGTVRVLRHDERATVVGHLVAVRRIADGRRSGDPGDAGAAGDLDWGEYSTGHGRLLGSGGRAAGDELEGRVEARHPVLGVREPARALRRDTAD